ncbi:hypothetical protein GCM10011581_08330 [Saccharopolyspora subtropica]|uniref:PE domain-containing protein n=1 Tax=Saccharopolyspora thermophila TaxID=89367 RepID=A0A917N786_9PSEU|nr:hypothetical protein [Saccharopolyspora subtropica]GGI73665.1 hypothetical protein GCM10011581_08330 [Saccharopolyspora subtropica]
MTTPAPPPPPPVPGGEGQKISVTKDTVLEARKIVLQAAEDAQAKLRNLRPSLAIQSPAKDQISDTAAAVWRAFLVGNPDSHFNRLNQYVTNVYNLGLQLEEAAKQYGFTDEEIEASFKRNAQE